MPTLTDRMADRERLRAKFSLKSAKDRAKDRAAQLSIETDETCGIETCEMENLVGAGLPMRVCLKCNIALPSIDAADLEAMAKAEDEKSGEAEAEAGNEG